MNETNFTDEAIQSFQVLDVSLLVAAAKGNIDLNELAKEELKNRGLNNDGKWVGFK